MLKNREYRWTIIAAAVLTVAVSLCGYHICGRSALFLVFAAGIGVTAVFAAATSRRYRDIDALSLYLEKVLDGAEALNIQDQKEGELSILKTNICKTATTLQYQKEQLADDRRALADAMADISHQLKTPLTSMMVMNDLLMTEDNREKRIEFLSIQSNQLDRMSWLIQTLLKLSKIDAGTIVMKTEEVSSDDMIREAVRPFEVQMDLKNIRFNYTPSEMIMNCDRNWSIEAVQNIVKNCIEHMESGDELTITASETNIYKEIRIADTGCGIAEEDLRHIFERFYKGKNAGKDSVGIGLALAKSIITNQHGDILVESSEGGGTAFFIRFYKTII